MALRLVTLAAAAAGARGAGKNPVVEMDLYGVLPNVRGPDFTLQNTNMMSITGVLKYIHTEFLAEHEISPPERRMRKRDVNVVSRSRFMIKNPATVVADPGYPETLVADVDFGPFMNFEDGRVTSENQVGLIQRHGDMVGVQEQRDERFTAKDPYYWFSLSGFCPELSTANKPNQTWIKKVANQEICQGRNEAECTAKSDKCFWEWSGNWLTSCNLWADLAAVCSNYTNTTGVNDHIRGGLCPGGAGVLGVIPTGEFGCTYSYGPVQEVSLDVLTGITAEDCGGRKCGNWTDFRDHCTNEKYRQRFEGGSSTGTVPFSYCVEYDIVPACASSCNSKACQKIPESEREIGLPFWRGRCNAEANQVRAEKLAKAFGIVGARVAHQLVADDLLTRPATCVNKVPGMCAPGKGQGGMYCSREWAGVCQPCYIPGTVQPYGAAQYQPTCPYNILSTPDYHSFPSPECASNKPRDLCCIYTGKCSSMVTNPDVTTLDEDGYALVASTKNTLFMAAFLERVVKAKGLTRTTGAVNDFAYAEWSRGPRAGRTLEAVVKDMTASGLLVATTTTTTTTTATATTTTTAAAAVVVVSDSQVATVSSQSQGGLPWWAWALIVGGVVAVASIIAAVACLGGKARKKRKGELKMVEQPMPEEAPQAVATAPVETVAAPITTYSAVPQLMYSPVATAVAPPQYTAVIAAPQAYAPLPTTVRTYTVSSQPTAAPVVTYRLA